MQRDTLFSRFWKQKSVKAKTRAAFEALGGHVVVQDSGFAIEALNGGEDEDVSFYSIDICF